MNSLQQLGEVGQSVWLDNVSRCLIRNGELATLIERDGLKGVTSNPSIFEKAIGGSGGYDADLIAFARSTKANAVALYGHLAVGESGLGIRLSAPRRSVGRLHGAARLCSGRVETSQGAGRPR